MARSRQVGQGLGFACLAGDMECTSCVRASHRLGQPMREAMACSRQVGQEECFDCLVWDPDCIS